MQTESRLVYTQSLKDQGLQVDNVSQELLGRFEDYCHVMSKKNQEASFEELRGKCGIILKFLLEFPNTDLQSGKMFIR